MRLIEMLKALKSGSENTNKMTVIHALQPLRKSIFLAGPTPRSEDVPSWRPDALTRL